MREMTRKTVAFHMRRSSMRCLYGGQASPALPSRLSLKMQNCVVVVGPFLGQRCQQGGRLPRKSAAKPSSARRGTRYRSPQPREVDRGVPAPRQDWDVPSRGREAAWNSTLGRRCHHWRGGRTSPTNGRYRDCLVLDVDERRG